MARIRRTGETEVSLDELERRALVYLEDRKARGFGLATPASVADAIWPGHTMRSQGAGLAASKILRRLAERGAAQWRTTSTSWGWEATAQDQMRTYNT